MRTIHVSGLCTCLGLLLLLSPGIGSAAMIGEKEYVIDFTRPEAFKRQALLKGPELVTVSPRGLGFDVSSPAARRARLSSGTLSRLMSDVSIITSQPVAIGFDWRPVRSVGISAKVTPPGFKLLGGSTIPPSGALFASFSPDAKHWSQWQVIPRQRTGDHADPQQVYSGQLAIPRIEQEDYDRYLQTYSMRMAVPWGSDEKAAVKWILTQDPKFFEKHLPFIGYVRFLYEISLSGDQVLRQITINLSYGTGGINMVPADPAVTKQREGPWSFRAE